MKNIRFLGFFLLLLVGLGLTVPPAVDHSPTEGKEASESAPVPADSFYVAEGLQATLWAETPLFYNPTNIDVDEEGRVWVLETVDYRNFNNAPESHLTHPQGERVVILEDTDGDGRADDSKVFVQDTALVSPLGLTVVGNKVYVSSSPNLYVYTDTNGDDKADQREVFLTGFGGLDHDHGLHAITVGPGGRYYFNAGNAGPHIVTDPCGWTLRAGSIYNGGTPYMGDNQPGLVSDDEEVWVGGVILRTQPDGCGLEVMAHNFRNAYEMTTDSYGNLWSNDNDDDGNASTRTLWVMEGGNVGYFSADGSRMWEADQRPGQETFTAHWHQEDPGVIPAGDRTGPGAPTGIVMYESSALGEQYRGMLLSADAGRNVVYGYRPEPKGAGYALDAFVFFSSLPDSVVFDRSTYENWDPQGERYFFRPSDVAVGTDGAIYVADWYDARVGGHAMQDTIGYGRIYRITPVDQELEAPTYDLTTTEGQIQALLSPAKNVRYQGFTRLKEQGTAVLEEVKALLHAENPYHRARAVWLLAQLGPSGIKEVEKVLQASDPQMRVTAFRALRQVQDLEEVLGYAQLLADDSSPVVRRAVAVALQDVSFEKDGEIILELAKHYGGDDRWMLEALGLAAEGDEAAVYELLKDQLGSSDPSQWSESWADMVWRLHPVAAVDELKARAAAPALSGEEKEQALVALGFIDDREALAAMEALSESSQPEVAERAQWWLDYRRTNEWHDLKDWQADDQTVAEEQTLKKMQRLREKVLNEEASPQERIAAAAEMAQTPQGGRLLLSTIKKEKLPLREVPAVQEDLLNNPDRTVRVLTRRYLELPQQEAAFSAEHIASLEGDQKHGQMLFYSKCAMCHRAGMAGADVGPDLTDVKVMFDRQGLAKAILQPSSGIAHGFYPYRITTKDGNVVYGFLLAENEETIIIKDDNGQEHMIERDRIAQRKRLDVSLMPGPAELKLTEQDVADLVEFLATFEQK